MCTRGLFTYHVLVRTYVRQITTMWSRIGVWSLHWNMQQMYYECINSYHV